MCSRCKGTGCYGGKLNGPYAGPWKWCNCLDAAEAQHTQPNLVNDANAARDAILKLDRKQRRADTPDAINKDEYQGEF